MQILAIETSTEVCSLALYQEGKMHCVEEIMPRQHSQRLLPMVSTLMTKASTTLQACQAIAFGRGPGSFTGLRIAASVAQGLAFGLGVPVIPISTLAAMAHATQARYPQHRYVATLDARMQELYWAVYEDQGRGLVEIQTEQLSSIDALKHYVNASSHYVVCGPGWLAYATAQEVACIEPAYPSAIAVAELAVLSYAKGQVLSASAGLPVYVRNQVTHANTKG